MTLICTLMVCGATLSAQNSASGTNPKSRMYRDHYRADVELSWANPNYWTITTSQGYSFGNGLYVGGGVGFSAQMTKVAPMTLDTEIDPGFTYTPESNWSATYYVPVFADIKYNFLNRLASPFVDFKAGICADICNSGASILLNPSLGVDIQRYTIKAGYECQLGVWRHSKGQNISHLKLGVAFTF